jgi:hypothetical protein
MSNYSSLFCFCIPTERHEPDQDYCDPGHDGKKESLSTRKIAIFTDFVAIGRHIQSALQPDGYVVEQYDSLGNVSEQVLQQYHAILVDSKLGLDSLFLSHNDPSGIRLQDITDQTECSGWPGIRRYPIICFDSDCGGQRC